MSNEPSDLSGNHGGASITSFPLRRNGHVIAASLHCMIHGKAAVVSASSHSGVRVTNMANASRVLNVSNWQQLSLVELRDAAERQLKPEDL